jgi:S-(hydroxymethyl)mycothiol dehydrogenase
MAKVSPVMLESVNVAVPGRGEAVVAVQACGVCHTDVHYRDGGINDDFPFLLGHEAAGVVESVGAGVTQVAPGDFVVLNWRAVCGECRACRRGDLHYCFNTHNATQRMTLEDGTELTPALGIGAAVNTGAVTRGKSVAVIGCGGVGVAAIAGSALVGASPIIAVDGDARKLATAREMGATHTVDSSQVDPVPEIKRICAEFFEGADGADVVIEAVGRPETYKQAFYARDLAGTVVLVGVPTPEMKLELPLLDIFGRGGALKSSWYGDCLPTRDFPMLTELYLQGRIDLDAFVSEEIRLDEVEKAFERMHGGDVLRSVVVL